MPSAIYLAKKNIRKQGELMEYEKVRKVCVCVCKLESFKSENVCIMNYAIVWGNWPMPLLLF